MAKFVVVSKAPETLEKGEVVINQPNFLEQVEANKQKAPRNGLTAVNHLREILQSVGTKYDPELNAMRIKLVNYIGRPFKNSQELSVIVTEILKDQYPRAFQKVLEYDLSHRPSHTKLVYYVGDSTNCEPFFKAGLDSIDEKDVESYMTGKPKRTVGRPAITSEEAKEREQAKNTGTN
jgi:hypothetical protein